MKFIKKFKSLQTMFNLFVRGGGRQIPDSPTQDFYGILNISGCLTWIVFIHRGVG